MNNGFTLWFTGLPCSGKTTVSEVVAQELLDRGLKVEILDGDVVRQGLSKELGFSKEDRDIHIRRIGFVSKLLSRNGVAVLAAFVSPYRVIRDELRQEIENFVEVYVKCPVEVCIERDVKGMYKKALAGEIKNFTGISDPYEEPENPEVVIETDKETTEESAQKVLETLETLGYIPKAADVTYSEEEEEKIKQRLKALGYL
ncbi:TPA: adenylyl-sulfate kinase [Candidatus Poribacteria bacterium]|nr:adenylyl-sulfate kinase [Candidatus Poribacteria bacterium]